MSIASAMICPKCGEEMNLHAEKLIFSSPEETGYDAGMGGVVEEFHACAGCGAGASRPSSG